CARPAEAQSNSPLSRLRERGRGRGQPGNVPEPSNRPEPRKRCEPPHGGSR
ncbi:MAG: hypothetical protein AVDCRST_MAG89-5322, partial [uncultured Gemmatimonadetes bacterium]